MDKSIHYNDSDFNATNERDEFHNKPINKNDYRFSSTLIENWLGWIGSLEWFRLSNAKDELFRINSLEWFGIFFFFAKCYILDKGML